MYLDHFGLDRLPFETTANGQVFIDLPNHREALNTILFGLETGEGFVKIVGEVGTGKTALCRNLLLLLPETPDRVYLPNPMLSPMDLLRAVAEDLDLEIASHASKHDLQRTIRARLIDSARNGRRVLICVDEAQTMPEESLEELRLLSNLENSRGKLAQVILFGQPELDEKLASYSLRQLQQRIAFSARLVPLDRDDCRHYVERRLRHSGARGNTLFTPAAIERIYRGSGGIPRLVNILCHKSLIAAFSEGEYQVGRRHASRALSDTEGIQRWQTRPLAERSPRILGRKGEGSNTTRSGWFAFSRWSSPR